MSDITSIRILVTGAKGQLGHSLQGQTMNLPASWNFLWTDVDELDITSAEAIESFFALKHPEFVVNCAAYTAVDKAESEPDKALLINALAPELLAAVCHRHGARLIHVSTDYVFNGRKRTPYLENDPTDPQGIYGSTKLQGELRVMEQAPDNLILRTSWLYSEYGHNFVKTMLRLGREKEEINVVNDQFGSPTYAGDLATAILELIRNSHKVAGGVYHYCNQGLTTWHTLASKVMELAGLSCKVKAITTAGYPTAAHRPEYSVLDTQRIRTAIGIDIPDWQTSLKTCLGNLRDVS